MDHKKWALNFEWIRTIGGMSLLFFIEYNAPLVPLSNGVLSAFGSTYFGVSFLLLFWVTHQNKFYEQPS